MKLSEYELARRANLEAAARGEIKLAILPPRSAPETSEVYERPRGWRKLFIKVRKSPTLNARMAAILPTREEIEGTR